MDDPQSDYSTGYGEQSRQQYGRSSTNLYYERTYKKRTYNTHDIHMTDHTQNTERRDKKRYSEQQAEKSFQASRKAFPMAFKMVVMTLALFILIPLAWSVIHNLFILAILVFCCLVLYKLVSARMKRRPTRRRRYPKD